MLKNSSSPSLEKISPNPSAWPELVYDADAVTPPNGRVNADGMKLTLTCSGGRARPRTLRSSACTGNRWCWIASSMRVSTCRQKAATVHCGARLNTSGTTPATILAAS